MILKSFENFKSNRKELLYDSLEDLGWIFNSKTKRWDYYSLCIIDDPHTFLLDENGATFPMGEVNGLKIKYPNIKYLNNFPTKILNRDLDISNTNVESLEGFPKYCAGVVILKNTKITNLKGLENSLIIGELDLTSCKELTSLEGSPNYVKAINITECYNLKTLYGLNKAQNIFHNNKSSVPNIEIEFFKNSTQFGKTSINLKTYWQDLYWFIVENQKYKESYRISWPEDFFKTLPKEYQNLYRSNNSISKFSL